MDSEQGVRDVDRVDALQQLLDFARADRERNPVRRSPIVTDDSPGVKYHRAIETARKYGIKV